MAASTFAVTIGKVRPERPAGWWRGRPSRTTFFGGSIEIPICRYPGNLTRAATELAKDWRSDRYLRRLEALLVVADLDHVFLLSGTGELIEPDDGIMAVGSGGTYALAAVRALYPDEKFDAKGTGNAVCRSRARSACSRTRM